LAGGTRLNETVRRRRPAPAGPGLQARRLALLALFEAEFSAAPAVAALERLGRERGLSVDVRRHAARIVEGVEAHRTELDERIAGLAPAIPVGELGKVERTILRGALFEVLYSAATPSGEVIRDSVALARIYAGDAARRLVNGVLGSVSRSSAGGG
jgi:transcription antitermination protein NusB